MRIEQNKIAFAYFRLSREEAQKSESSSITNQRMIVNKYCEQNGINLVREFVDDGYSGGNFDRPGFQEMMRELDIDKVRAELWNGVEVSTYIPLTASGAVVTIPSE